MRLNLLDDSWWLGYSLRRVVEISSESHRLWHRWWPKHVRPHLSLLLALSILLR